MSQFILKSAAFENGEFIRPVEDYRRLYAEAHVAWLELMDRLRRTGMLLVAEKIDNEERMQRCREPPTRQLIRTPTM